MFYPCWSHHCNINTQKCFSLSYLWVWCCSTGGTNKGYYGFSDSVVTSVSVQIKSEAELFPLLCYCLTFVLLSAAGWEADDVVWRWRLLNTWTWMRSTSPMIQWSVQSPKNVSICPELHPMDQCGSLQEAWLCTCNMLTSTCNYHLSRHIQLHTIMCKNKQLSTCVRLSNTDNRQKSWSWTNTFVKQFKQKVNIITLMKVDRLH